MDTSVGSTSINFTPVTGVQAGAAVIPARRVSGEAAEDNKATSQASQPTQKTNERNQENKSAVEDTRQSAPTNLPAVGRIRFEIQDSTRVAQFFNTKDVLIYQVPPEGNLYLVKSQEASRQDQIETSA